MGGAMEALGYFLKLIIGLSAFIIVLGAVGGFILGISFVSRYLVEFLYEVEKYRLLSYWGVALMFFAVGILVDGFWGTSIMILGLFLSLILWYYVETWEFRSENDD